MNAMVRLKFACCLIALAALSHGAMADEKKPNVVFILADNVGWLRR